MVYALDLDSLPQDPNYPADTGLPTIVDTLKDELGLELVSAKGTDKILVVDHVEEPTPN